ncbi:hypothetical protein BofuT4_P156440.1 [Botrytis cinerea T4]|uniref:Uncharacterized protein n=1 Tax=Botryotinia fuckeliana (strain T4) TaxID=999810 RepID=G2YUF0_BOTF4|nr:hypothetical protein BofuT4_P156440.1 [Botrytis cinerea T4]
MPTWYEVWFSKVQVSILPSMALVIPWKWTSSSARGVFMAGGLMMRIRWEIIGLGSHSRYKEQGSEIKSTVQTRQARTITDVCMKRNKGFRMRITTSKSKMFERIDVQRDSVYTWQLRSLPVLGVDFLRSKKVDIVGYDSHSGLLFTEVLCIFRWDITISYQKPSPWRLEL